MEKILEFFVSKRVGNPALIDSNYFSCPYPIIYRAFLFFFNHWLIIPPPATEGLGP